MSCSPKAAILELAIAMLIWVESQHSSLIYDKGKISIKCYYISQWNIWRFQTTMGETEQARFHIKMANWTGINSSLKTGVNPDTALLSIYGQEQIKKISEYYKIAE